MPMRRRIGRQTGGKSALRCLALSLSLVAACAPHRASPARSSPGQAIAVLQPNNRTRNPLLVSGASFLDRHVFHAERVTVADVLASEARLWLAERGFRVVPRESVDAATDHRVPQSPQDALEIASRGKLEGRALYLEIRRWEPDAPVHTGFVVVGLSASLVDPASGNVVWQLDRSPAPVSTPGEVTLGSAYETAARKVIAEILRTFDR
jgi:hypothetical protein